MDAQIERMARLVVNWCTRIKNGDHVFLVTNDPAAEALFRAIERSALEKKAVVISQFVSNLPPYDLRFATRNWIQDISLDELKSQMSHLLEKLAAADVIIGIEAIPEKQRPKEDPEKSSALAKILEPAWEIVQNKRYVETFFPTREYADEAGIPHEELMDMYLSACLTDRAKLGKYLKQIRGFFEGAKEVRILTKDTNLAFSLSGRSGIMENGKENLPGGEVYFAPREDSIEGQIHFSFPGIYFGQNMGRIQLTFKNGRVVSARAEMNQKNLEAILDTDEGARSIGEFGIGCNPGVTQFTRELYMDEVTRGTVHLALGDSYPECEGNNHSAIHFDIIKDLREGGEIWVDGKIVNKNGSWKEQGGLT